jgi:hypothetical protein
MPACEDFSTEGNVEYLKSHRGFSAIETSTIPEIKAFLNECGIPIREAVGEQVHG